MIRLFGDVLEESEKKIFFL